MAYKTKQDNVINLEALHQGIQKEEGQSKEEEILHGATVPAPRTMQRPFSSVKDNSTQHRPVKEDALPVGR